MLGYGTIDDSLRHCQCCRQNSFAQVSAEETLDADKFAADFSLDDKAKVSVGEPGHPATAGARPNKKAIVGAGQELRCADHDTGVVAKVVPAVQLRMDLCRRTSQTQFLKVACVFVHARVHTHTHAHIHTRTRTHE